MLKKIALLLPFNVRQELRRFKYYSEISRGKLISTEPEVEELSQWVGPGDWALDVGANIGSYTLKMASLVGAEGRVFAFEPMLDTAEVLCSNIRYAGHSNVTVLNFAASDQSQVLQFAIQAFSSGMPNYFRAHADPSGPYRIFSVSIDQMDFPHRIALAKIDTEGAEEHVIAGMKQIILRDHPV